MMKRPFVKTIRTGTSFYIYDVNSNELIRVRKRIYDLVDEIGTSKTDAILAKFKHKYTEDEIRSSIKEIENVQSQHNLFLPHRPVICSGWSSAGSLRKAIEYNLSQLILEVTSRCNLRCKYCSFSGRYSNFRSHGSDDMSLDTAFRAIEYFNEQSHSTQDKLPPTIGFYGGETLLGFDLIKEIVKSLKKKGVFDRFHFNLTTNGTLLTDEIITFFADNNVSVTVSLDGPALINDRFRVFPNGEGTFDIVLANLKKIKKSHPSYFKDRILINAVVSPPYPLNSIIRFFSRRKLFEPILENVGINFVDNQNTTFFKDFDLEKERDKLAGEFKRVRNRYKRALIRGSSDGLILEKSLFLEDFHTISRRLMTPLEKIFPPLGICLPGQRRLFVSTEGKFYMCERVGANYEIGDVEKGLDYQRIFDFFTAYDEFFKDCGDCWALRLCKKCFNNVRKGDQLDAEAKRKLCRFMLRNIEANLTTYCEILEENPEAFKVFEKVKML